MLNDSLLTMTMTMSELPPELVTEILSRLPVKDLLRFRCVSKTWLRLLTHDSQFIQLHLNRSNKENPSPNPSIMVVRNGGLDKTHFHYASDFEACDKAIKFDLPFYTPPLGEYDVLGVCNGLLGLAHYSPIMPNPCIVYVWNPLRKDHVTIPCPPISSDEKLSSTVFGFGYHQGTNEYKVVRIVRSSQAEIWLESKFHTHVSVYTLGTNSWRNVKGIDFKINSSATLFNGALYWCAAQPGFFFSEFIVSFDLKDEVFRLVLLPGSLTECYRCDYEFGVVELGGFFCMSCKIDDNIEIWVMKEYRVVGSCVKDSWIKQYTIGVSEIDVLFESLQPLAVVNSGEIIIKKDFLQLIMYDPDTNSSRSLRKFGFEAYDDVYIYRGSLVSPRLINGVGDRSDIEGSRKKKKRDDAGAEV